MKLVRYISPVVGFLSAATPVFAQELKIKTPPGFEIENLGVFITNLIGIALIIAALLVFVYLIWGGIQWITSGGDKAKTEEARNRITAALVGLAIVAAAWAVIQLVTNFFGIDFNGDIQLPTAYEEQ